MRPILRVMLVDDHGFVRSAIRQALTAPDIEVVGRGTERRGGAADRAGAPTGRRC